MTDSFAFAEAWRLHLSSRFRHLYQQLATGGGNCDRNFAAGFFVMITGVPNMRHTRTRLIVYALAILACSIIALTPLAHAQSADESCQTTQEMDGAARAAIDRAVNDFYSQAASGNAEAMRANAIPAVASGFDGIANAVQANRDKISGGQATLRTAFLLNAPGAKPYERAEFYCGLFNSAQRTSIIIPNLPPGTYALAIQDVAGSKQPYQISYVLQQLNGQWKLAGYYARPRQVGPHDGLWYWVKARDYQKNGQAHNAWFYYLTAADLLAPVPFMSTPQLDKLTEEERAALPRDIPQQQPVPMNVNGKTYQVLRVFPAADDKQGLNLVVNYQAADISNQVQTFQDNMSFIKGLLAQYPEYRDGFTNIIAQAVTPQGQMFPTTQPIKDVK
jgi:hypothetical protein